MFVDGLWIPLSRGVEGPVVEEPLLLEEPPPPGPLSFPECGVSLSVPAYGQGWSPWGDDYLCNNPTHCGQMWECGCAITSATMVFKYFGAGKNPGQVNSCCGSQGCCADCSGTPEYDPCCLVWSCASSHCSDNEAGYGGYYSFYWEGLCGVLRRGRPPIVKLVKGGSTHFVVVKAGIGYDIYDPRAYRINDPLDGSTYKTLAAYTGSGWSPSRIAEYYNK